MAEIGGINTIYQSWRVKPMQGQQQKQKQKENSAKEQQKNNNKSEKPADDKPHIDDYA